MRVSIDAEGIVTFADGQRLRLLRFRTGAIIVTEPYKSAVLGWIDETGTREVQKPQAAHIAIVRSVLLNADIVRPQAYQLRTGGVVHACCYREGSVKTTIYTTGKPKICHICKKAIG